MLLPHRSEQVQFQPENSYSTQTCQKISWHLLVRSPHLVGKAEKQVKCGEAILSCPVGDCYENQSFTAATEYSAVHCCELTIPEANYAELTQILHHSIW